MNIKEFSRFPKEVNEAYWRARRYINEETGQVISRRDYQTLAKGGLKPEEIAAVRRVAKVQMKGSGKTRAYSALVNTYKKHTAAKLGVKPSQVKVRGDSPEAVKFRENVKKLIAFNKKHKQGEKRTRDEERELGKILVDMNMRPPTWEQDGYPKKSS